MARDPEARRDHCRSHDAAARCRNRCRHAVVAFGTDWVEDASRRDFTLNALYCDADGTLFDPLDGVGDAVMGVVRFIGAARERIEEDGLRFYRSSGFPRAMPASGLTRRVLPPARRRRSARPPVARTRWRRDAAHAGAAKGGENLGGHGDIGLLRAVRRQCWRWASMKPWRALVAARLALLAGGQLEAASGCMAPVQCLGQRDGGDCSSGRRSG